MRYSARVLYYDSRKESYEVVSASSPFPPVDGESEVIGYAEARKGSEFSDFQDLDQFVEYIQGLANSPGKLVRYVQFFEDRIDVEVKKL